MNPNQTLKKRDLYLNKLIKFKDMEVGKNNYRYKTLRKIQFA